MSGGENVNDGMDPVPGPGEGEPEANFSVDPKRLKLDEEDLDSGAVEETSDGAESMDEFEDVGEDDELEQVYRETSDKISNDVQILSQEQVVQRMLDDVREVKDVIKESPTITRSLLNHFKWDKQKLYDAFYATDKMKLFCDARIVNETLSLTTSNACEQCGTQSMRNGMACGHRYCLDCWTDHLTSKINDGLSTQITCIDPDCKVRVDYERVMELVTDPNVVLEYQRLTIDHYVQNNRLMRWCSGDNCTNAVLLQYVDWKAVTCSCGHESCFECGQEWHYPVKCIWLQKMTEKINDADFQSNIWLAMNTKSCPSCSVVIEKQISLEGKRVTCTSCNTVFCWVCLMQVESGCWSHDNWCNGGAEETDSYIFAERYLFHKDRYLSQKQSLDEERTLLTSVKALDMKKMPEIDIQQLKIHLKAAEILCECRQTLIYTDVMVYFLQKNSQVEMLKKHLQDLESATKKLSENLKMDFVYWAEMKIEVQHKLCEKLRQVLLGYVKEGYEHDWWVYEKQ